jgi:hypothetical protein
MQLMHRISICMGFCVDSRASSAHALVTHFCPAHMHVHQAAVKRPSIFGYFV